MVNLGFREGVMGWDLGKLLWKSGVDWVVYISAVGYLGYVEACDSCQGCNDHALAMCIYEVTLIMTKTFVMYIHVSYSPGVSSLQAHISLIAIQGISQHDRDLP